MKKYYILNNNTFGYSEGASDDETERFFHLVVLAVDVAKGGDPLLLNKSILADRTRCKLATKEDAECFGVII